MKFVNVLVALGLLFMPISSALAMEAPTIRLIAPNGGENWEVGSVQTISWENGGFTDIRLDYRVSDSAPWQLIVDGLTSYDPSSYSWIVPNTPTTTAMVRVEGYFSGGGPNERYDYSDDYFTISNPVPAQMLTVVSPNGGERWKLGSKQLIHWTSVGIDRWAKIKIELDRGNGRWRTLGYMPNFGYFGWRVTGPQTRTALVRVSLVKDPGVNDVSDNYFTISNR